MASEQLSRYNAYLNNLKSLTAHIEQKNPNGTKSLGILYIKKPGCLRLKYTPGPRELIADGEELVQYNGPNKDSDSIALSRTPLYFLLRASGRLEDHATIHQIISGKRWTQIILTSKDDPDAGEVVLVFQENPLQLVRWNITDPQGNKTVVTLSAIRVNGPIDPDIFRIRHR